MPKIPQDALAVFVRGWPRIDTFSVIVISAAARKQSPRLILAEDVSEVEARFVMLRWNGAHGSKCA